MHLLLSTVLRAAAPLLLSSGATRGGKGEASPPCGWTSKNYVICVCFHCHGTSSYHTTNTKPYKFPMHCSKCVSFWGNSYSIDLYLTSSLLQNPGGATAAEHRRLLSIDIFCQWGAQQQTRCTPLDGTDRRTDVRPFHIDQFRIAYALRVVSIIKDNALPFLFHFFMFSQ